MPFAHEHASRQADPSGYVRFRRKTLMPGVDAIIGIPKSGGSEVQSIRLDSEKFTAAEARAWLKDHGFKTTLEEAVEKYELLILNKSANEKRYTLGVVYEPDTLDTDEEFSRAEDIEKAAWDFMALLQSTAKSEVAKRVGLDDEHDQVDDYLGTVVESYCAPVDMKINGQPIKKGSWLLGVQWTPDMWKKIKTGDRTGLSMYGRANRVKETV